MAGPILICQNSLSKLNVRTRQKSKQPHALQCYIKTVGPISLKTNQSVDQIT